MIPHQTSHPRPAAPSNSDCTQSKRSAAVTELENAVAHFQATLTDEDRKRLQGLKELPREAQSIIVFTAELDMQQSGKRRGKSIASRLTSFLQIVQKFTPIIDTYIQSNPDISAIIWSSIKLTFMVIHLIRQSTLANQVWKAITGSFQTEIRTYVENVKAKAENAQCEIELAKAQADYEEQQQQTKERQNASDYRQQLSAWATKYSAAMKDLQDLKEQHSKDKKRVRLINELTSYNFMPTFNSMRNKRHMGTAEWCFRTTEYREWANANKSAVLHITGKIGSGKTILVLQEAKSSLFSAESLRLLFTTASKNLDDWFIVIDGLDEVDIIRQIGLLKFLRDVLDQLPEPHRIKLLLSSRETSSSDIDRILPRVTRLYTGRKPTSADIRLYAEDLITNKISANELIVTDPGLENEIIEAIHRKEKGMFLWVCLTINDICSRKSDKDIRRALQDIPGDLPATFDRTLGRIAAKKNNIAIVQKEFTLIQASFEPLTLDQLREALSVDIGQQSLDHDDLISGVDRLPIWCENLICIEASDTVHFSHHSIQKYLLTPGSEGFKEFHLERDKCDRFMGELCVTYISLDNFQRALGFTRKCNTDSSQMNIDMGGLAEQTIRTAVGDSIGSLIGRFTREAVGPSQTTSPGKVRWNGSRLSSFPRHNFGPSQSSEEYTFFNYACKHWYKHQLCIDSNDNEATWRLLGQILRRPRQYSQGEPWFQPAWTKAVSEIIGNDVLFFGPGFDSYRETAVSLETDENDQTGVQQDCTCGRRTEYPLREEMCQLLKTGYRRHEQPYLFPLAVLAEELDTGPSVERLRTLNRDKRFDVELMLSSKTRLGRSVFDILIEGALTDMQRMQVFLSERLYSRERPRDQDNGLFGLLGKSNEPEHIRLQRQLDNTLTFLGAVQAAATHGIEVIENSLAQCLETGGSVPLHKATITLLFDKILLQNRWPTSICEGIVKVFFGESLIPGYEEANETILSRAVHSNSWELAVSLIDIQPVSTDEMEAVGDFSYIKHALRCRDCRSIAMQMPKSRKKWSFDLRTIHGSSIMPDPTPPIVVGCLLDVSGSMRNALEPGQSNEPAGDRLRAVLRAALKLAKAERQQNSNTFMFVGVFGLRTSEDHLNPQAADLCGIADALLNDSGNSSSGHDLLIARANANNVPYISKYIKTKLTCREARIVDAHLELHPDTVQEFIDAIPPEAQVNRLRSSSRIGGASISAALGVASMLIPGVGLASGAVNAIGSVASGLAFGEAVEDSGVERSEALALARRIQEDWLSDLADFNPRPIYEVVDILQRLQDQWLHHEEIDSRNVPEDNDNLYDAIRQYIYGVTPMFYALKKALDAFRSKPEAERRILVLMSDGNSTDGDPSTVASELGSKGVSIATVNLADDRSSAQRALHYEVNPVWHEGTRKLFQMSKRIHALTHPVPVLAAAGWAIPSAGEVTLFCTVCSVTALEEFCSLLLSARFGSADALLDIVGRIRHDNYINNEHLTIRGRPTDQGQRGICYAHAVASVIHMALLRIVSRAGGIPSFNEIRDRILSSYPETEDGQYVTEVLLDASIWYRPLHFQEVDEEGAREAVLQRRPVLATFGLSEKGWDTFGDHFDESSAMRNAVLTEAQMAPNFDKKYDGGHAVVLVSCSPNSLTFLNSWGSSWGDNGMFEIEKPAVLGHRDEPLRFYDVYWIEEELTHAEREAFDARVDEELRRHAEEHESIFELEYRCPRCFDNSVLADFTGNVRRALCPKCQGWFEPDPGSLAQAMYLRAGLNDVVRC
ncbi:hypothetical protein H9Q70_005209 [Fusarium xylarioides]|nr:hypothetical protein H9Q70_005209 [Fusarium xylarioides]